ncbi:DUF86 domain-containing protein [Candidatus Dojkabacteria bacterium]|nr:DUF86 domain-containing protein [Candidatus Dojkabacteria bacterium]
MKEDKIYLAQIIDSVNKIKDFTKDFSYEAFRSDQKTQSAVIMQLAIIGEISKRLSQDTTEEIDLPWRQISSFRDRAIHDYYQIDIDIVWNTINSDLHELESKILAFLD